MTSASTLIRRSKTAKTPAAAKRLRALAAKKRRQDRAAVKQLLTGKTHARRKSASKQHREPISTVNRVHANRQPDHRIAGELAGARQTADYQPAQPLLIEPEEVERLRKLAYSRKDPALFELALRGHIVTAKSKGHRESDERNVERLRTVYEANRIAVVSGFVASMNAYAGRNNGPMPATVTVSGYTLARVMEALRDAGYTESGKDGVRRHG